MASPADPHPSSYELGYAGVRELQRRLDAREVTSRALVDTLLVRIDAIDSAGDIALHSLVGLSDEAGRVADERDRQRERGEIMGALHGIPVLIKDNIEAEGLPGCAGSTALFRRPTRDAALVTRLREAGAIILGSTNLSQWANIRSPFSTSGYSAGGGLVGNPWALDRSAGGSSSGSGAALAAGLAPLTVGTETDGSITCPASLNGVYGLKPTVNNVSRVGVVPISHSQDSPGPMARNLDDLALLYGVLSGTTPSEPTSVTMVEASNWHCGHEATDALFHGVMDRLRASGVALERRGCTLPSPQDYDDELTVMLSELLDDLDEYLRSRPGEGVMSLADVVAFEDEHRDVEQRYFGHEFFLRALASGGCASENYRVARARNVEWATQDCLIPALEGVDVVLSPAYGPAWKSDLVNGDNAKFVSPAVMAAAVAGWPIVTIPMGLVSGLPVGLTLVGRPQSEWTLIAAARQVQAFVAADFDVSAPTWRRSNRG